MHTEVYATVGAAIMICQLLAVLEVFHPLLGWVRTGVMMPLIQVSRTVVLAMFKLSYLNYSNFYGAIPS